MLKWKKTAERDCGYVEVMTTSQTGATFGYRLVGASAGPQVVIAAFCASAEHVFDRLLTIPTLPWMRGNLILVRMDLLEDMFNDLASLSSIGTVDRTVVLPWVDKEEIDESHIRRCYHMTLRACADLGMIAGRGVARST